MNAPFRAIAPEKFKDRNRTATGETRAEVACRALRTLWLNTGTLCNIECAGCYIESSPANDRLSYLTLEEAEPFLDEARALGAEEIGFTGGEPFMNPHMTAMAEAALERGFDALVLTNAMRPMMRPHVREALSKLRAHYGGRLRLRVSLDHYTERLHDAARGAGCFSEAVKGLGWLAQEGFSLSIAGRLASGESESAMRDGYARLVSGLGLPIDAADPSSLVLFPEMNARADTPEITSACWAILGKSPDDVMCAASRMVVKRKGAGAPAVVACTLLPYEEEFELGASLAEAMRPVKLNHPFCSQFCVLGGASCAPHG
ncbi:MAG: radical SAM protein [Alphaproteobacteria bacterium]|nr:radical SAM protein [Alphaproteobacteria bacterium]